jgi:hypothetical protein
MKGVACRGQRHSADTLRSERGCPGSPGLPNRANQDGTSKVWPRANSAPASRAWEVVAAANLMGGNGPASEYQRSVEAIGFRGGQ